MGKIQDFEELNKQLSRIDMDNYSRDMYIELELSMCELKNNLILKRLFVEVEKEFVNKSLYVCCVFLEHSENFEDFSERLKLLKEEWLYELGIIGHTRGYFIHKEMFELLLYVLEKSPVEIWEFVQIYKKRPVLEKNNNKVDLEPKVYMDVAPDIYNDILNVSDVLDMDYDLHIEMKEGDKEIWVPVVLASDNNYVLPMLVTIFSLLKNAGTMTRYELNLLLSGDFTEENKFKIKQICELYPRHKVKFVDMQLAYKNAYLRVAHISTATYYRLQLPSILGNTDKCIYLDVDVVVKKDLSGLYKTNMEEAYLVGVCAAGYYESAEKIEYHKKRLQLPVFDKYLNAGVLVMNLKKMREDGLEDIFDKLLDKKWESQDQDILNAACYGKIKTVDFQYNVMTKYPVDNDEAYNKVKYLGNVYTRQEWNRGRKVPAIIHYADRIKPWQVAGSVLAREWWDVVKQMPAEIVADFMSAYITDIIRMARVKERKAVLCEKQLIEMKTVGAVENERILKYKLQYENENQKHEIKELSQKLNSSNIINGNLIKEREELKSVNQRLKKQNINLSKKAGDLKRLQQSKSYKIGRWITWIPRKIVFWFR